MDLGVTVLMHTRGLCLLHNLNRMKSPFPDVFDDFLFLYTSSIPSICVSSSHFQKNTDLV